MEECRPCAIVGDTLLPEMYPLRLRACSGADERNRTLDLLITNELLYRLSYIGPNVDSS